MLRRIVGTLMVAGVLTAIPFTIQGLQRDRLPTLAMNDLRCEETGVCCPQLNSICLVDGQAHINRREALGGKCKSQ